MTSGLRGRGAREGGERQGEGLGGWRGARGEGEKGEVRPQHVDAEEAWCGGWAWASGSLQGGPGASWCECWPVLSLRLRSSGFRRRSRHQLCDLRHITASLCASDFSQYLANTSLQGLWRDGIRAHVPCSAHGGPSDHSGLCMWALPPKTVVPTHNHPARALLPSQESLVWAVSAL